MSSRSIADLPGPRRLPLLGNAHQLVRQSRIHLIVEEWCRHYGPIFRADVGRKPFIGIGDAGAINEILRDRPEGFRRPRDLEEVINEMGWPTGVFAAEGDDWKRQRRLVITALNTNHLHRYFDVVCTCTERLYRRLAGAARDGGSVDLADELTSFTVDVTSALALGHDLNTLERRDNELQGHIQRVFEMTARRIAAPIPYWRWLRLPADRALDRSTVEIKRAIAGFIEQARARLAEQPQLRESPTNLLESMLAAQEAEGAFDDSDIIGTVKDILLAGEDTTAHTLGWTAWFLASRIELQRRLATEASAAFGHQPYATEYEATEDLPFTEAVLNETLRLKTVVPLMILQPNEDRTILDTHIPAGTQLLVLLRHATRTAAGRSDDFYPERWLEDSDETRAPKSLSFGAGPRFCPGRNLAMLESKVVLTMIARNFELELDDSGGPVRESFGFTIVPQGLRVRLLERSAAIAEPSTA